MSGDAHGPFRIGDRVILKGVYKGEIVGHRGPQAMVKLNKPIGEHKVVVGDQFDLRLDPNAPPRKPPPDRPPLNRPHHRDRKRKA